MSNVPGLLVIAGLFLLPAATMGLVAAGVVRATRRNLAPAELRHTTMVAFWIAAVLTLAGEIVLFGMCISSLSG